MMKEAAIFMQRVLERLSEVQLQAEAVDVPLLRRFSAVVVEDSSSVLLPAELAEVWLGCGGSVGTSAAAVKLFVMRLQYGTGLYTRSGHQLECAVYALRVPH
jgi:hypothetical protein